MSCILRPLYIVIYKASNAINVYHDSLTSIEALKADWPALNKTKLLVSTVDFVFVVEMNTGKQSTGLAAIKVESYEFRVDSLSESQFVVWIVLPNAIME